MRRLLCALLAAGVMFGLAGCGDTGPRPPPPPEYHSISYDLVDGLIAGILNDFTQDVLQQIEDEQSRDGSFRNFAVSLKNGSVPLYVPYHEGEVVAFQNKAGFYNITMYPYSTYGEPWIYYYPDSKQSDVFGISILYLDDEIKAHANEITGSALIRQIAPDAPNLHNRVKYWKYRMYESEIKLGDRTVNALVQDPREKDDKRIYNFFAYDDVLVVVRSLPGAKADAWLEGLTFEKVQLT